MPIAKKDPADDRPVAGRIVLSASRRTDIPAFYMPWFMARLQLGFFDVVNPFNRHSRRVDATPDAVHSIVFWSKNFGPFIKRGCGEALARAGYRLFFQFTLNAECRVLEPRVPPMEERLDQMAALCDRFGPEAVMWRWDPVVLFIDHTEREKDNLHGFEAAVREMARLGIRYCTTSFLDPYAKVLRRAAGVPGFRYVAPAMERRIDIAAWMAEVLETHGMRLLVCCEKELLSHLAPVLGPAGCISRDRLEALFGRGLTPGRDPGQRRRKGCTCDRSVDIGDYKTQPCFHNCLFCYANPKAPASGDFLPEMDGHAYRYP